MCEHVYGASHCLAIEIQVTKMISLSLSRELITKDCSGRLTLERYVPQPLSFLQSALDASQRRGLTRNSLKASCQGCIRLIYIRRERCASMCNYNYSTRRRKTPIHVAYFPTPEWSPLSLNPVSVHLHHYSEVILFEAGDAQNDRFLMSLRVCVFFFCSERKIQRQED